jgi:hypothetical protein
MYRNIFLLIQIIRKEREIMTAGHFGFSAIVKSKEQKVPLWALMFSTYLLDFVFIILVSFGVESFSLINPGHPAYGGAIIHAYYSHSLVGALIISLIAGLLARWKWNKKFGLVIGGVVFSHWILDLIVHRPDLPILPGNIGNLPLLGFGLWNLPIVSAIVELGLVVAGAYLYYKSTRKASKASGKSGKATLASSVTGIVMLMILISDVFSISLGLTVLLILVLIIFCGWLDSRLSWNLEPTKEEILNL